MFATNDTGIKQQIQEDCALSLRLDGFADGYDGKLTQSDEFEYLKGYFEGVVRGTKEDIEKSARLAEYREREEALERGEPDWLDQVMQDNDEPTLVFDEF